MPLSSTIWDPKTTTSNKTTPLRMSSSPVPPISNTGLNIIIRNSNSNSNSFTGSDETSLNYRSITTGHRPSSQRLKFCQICKSLSLRTKCSVRPWPTVLRTSSIGQVLSDLRSTTIIWIRRHSRLANVLDCQLLSIIKQLLPNGLEITLKLSNYKALIKSSRPHKWCTRQLSAMDCIKMLNQFRRRPTHESQVISSQTWAEPMLRVDHQTNFAIAHKPKSHQDSSRFRYRYLIIREYLSQSSRHRRRG